MRGMPNSHLSLRHSDAPVHTRSASIDAQENTVQVVWSTGAAVPRFDLAYSEVLDLSPDCVDLSRFENGAV